MSEVSFVIFVFRVLRERICVLYFASYPNSKSYRLNNQKYVPSGNFKQRYISLYLLLIIEYFIEIIAQIRSK